MGAAKAALGFLVYGLTLIVVLAAFAGYYGMHEYTKPSTLDTPVVLVIEPGSSSSAIAEKLLEHHIFDDETDILLFKAALKLQNKSSALKAGEYEFPAGINIKDTIALLESGKTVQRQVTIREGLTSFEIARLLSGVEDLAQKDSEVPAEGTLLPETYSYQKGESNADILKRMDQAMFSTVTDLCGITFDLEGDVHTSDVIDMACEVAPAPLKTIRDVLTLASIVEKETGLPEERKTVAGVFLNRLRKDIPLQTDPTVIYALTKGEHKNGGKGPLGRRLLLKDLEINDPYNTYKYPGLPPGPIANPGRASIEAVILPEEHEFYYFVADGTGGHVFAKTLAEHNANVAKWRKIRRAQKK